MTLLQKFVGFVYPPYKFKLEREGNERLISAIINVLPSSFDLLKEQKKVTRTLFFSDREDIPNFKFISQFYPEESIRKYTDKSKNFKLSGIQILHKRTSNYIDVELLIHNGHISGISLANNVYSCSAFDLEKLKVNNLLQEDYRFPPTEVDLFFESLAEKDRNRIDEIEFMDIQLGNRTYFTIFDMEDGNYIGIDKKQKVYSLVHDAVPMAKAIKKTLDEMLSELASGEFDVEDHLNERYAKSK